MRSPVLRDYSHTTRGGKLGFKYSSQNLFSPHCATLPLSRVRDAGQYGIKMRKKCFGVSSGAPQLLLCLGRLPASSFRLLGPPASSWLATWYFRAPPASPLHPPAWDGTEEDVINRAAPLGLAASGTSSGWFNFPWCLSFSASISLFFLSLNLLSCAYAYREPQLRLVTMEGGGEWMPPGSFTLLGFFFFFVTVQCVFQCAIWNLFHTTLQGRDHHSPYFTDKKDESLSSFPKDTG